MIKISLVLACIITAYVRRNYEFNWSGLNVHAPVSFYFCGVTKAVFNATAEFPLIKLYVHVQ